LTDSEFTGFLISRGLACFGSDETIADLRKRFGVRSWFRFQDVIELPPVSLFEEQTERFFIRDDRTCLVPPSEFECDFDYDHDALRTYERAFERLTAIFGPSKKGASVNTLESTWNFERMSLTIRTFLREKTPSRSPLYDKHPELWNFCRISINRNWVCPLTQHDARPVHSIDVQSFTSPETRGLTMWERGLFRLAATGDTPPQFWWIDETFGWRAGRWSASFERNSMMKLKLDQAEPGRSSGYSQLSLILPNPFSLQHEPVTTLLVAGAAPHTLDSEAQKVSTFWGLPLEIEKFDSD